MDLEDDKLVEAIEEGRIVKVPEFYAKRENLPILRKPNIDELRKNTFRMAPGIPRHIKDEHKKPFLDYLRRQPSWKDKQVTSELINNFHWFIRLERRKKGLSRKQFAKLLNENEENLKIIEAGILPSSDFILINKIQQALNINLRKDRKDFSKDITKVMLKSEKQTEKEKQEFKKINELDSSEDEIEIIEDEI